MNTFLRTFVFFVACVFLLTGIGWLIVPDIVGMQLGMTLLSGVGLSTQIGDFASFFVTLGSCMLFSLKTGNRVWLYIAIIMLCTAAFGRLIAWLFHGAAIAPDMIGAEVVIAFTLYFMASTLPKQIKR